MRILFRFLLYLPTPFLRGFVLATYWRWFVVPTFRVAPISAAAAYGIAALLFIAVHVPDFNDAEKEWDEAMWAVRIIISGYFLPLLSIAIGWMVQRWWL